MVLFTILHTMRRKRTRSSLSTSTSSTDATSSVSSSRLTSSAPSSPTASISSSSSSFDEKPHINGKNGAGSKKTESRNSYPSKPPRKKLKTVNMNGSNGKKAEISRQKGVEISVIEKVKKRHQEAAQAKLKRQLELEAQAVVVNKKENNPKQPKLENGKAAKGETNGHNNGKSLSSKSSTSTTVARQSSIASSDTQKPRKVQFNGKSEGRAHGKKTDPEVIFRLFDKPSRLYQLLATRLRESPYILRRNLSYMAPKQKFQVKRKNERFKLPAYLTERPEVLRAVSSPKKGNSRHSSAGADQQKTRTDNLHLVFCQVVGEIPGQVTATNQTRSSSNKRASIAVKAESFMLDVAVVRSYVGRKQETETRCDVIASDMNIEFIKDCSGSSASDDDFFSNNTHYFENGHLLKTVIISGSLLYPPNGYIVGCANIRLRVTAKNSGWSYSAEMSISVDRNPPAVQNGLYSLNVRPINGADQIKHSHPRLLFAAFWSSPDVTLSSDQIFTNIRKDIAVKSMSSPQPPVAVQQLQSPVSSPSRSVNSRSRIIRVCFWLSDPAAGGPGICASVANPFRCPWCHTVCPHFLSLLRHLRCWHPRFGFVLQAERVARVADILVTLNRRYDCAEENRYPPAIVADVPMVGVRQPQRRLSNSQLIWFSGRGKHRRHNFHKASSTALAEFRRPETDLHPLAMNAIMASGHLRVYYHSQTCMPMHPDDLEKDCDSDCEEQPWLTEQTWRLLNEFTDVNPGEKSMMNMWNRFMYREKFYSQRSIFAACLAFVDEFGPEIVANGLLGNFRLHLTCLFQNNLLNSNQLYAVMARLQEKLKQGKTFSFGNGVGSPTAASTSQ